jgi:hypothetical protein
VVLSIGLRFVTMQISRRLDLACGSRDADRQGISTPGVGAKLPVRLKLKIESQKERKEKLCD